MMKENNTSYQRDINISEIEWYIDYISFRQMMKHKNDHVIMDKDYMYMQMFNTIFKTLHSQISSSGNERGGKSI